jgi:hypothetical protein
MMNHRTRVMRRPRRAWPPAAPTVAAILATAALALLVTACSGSPSSTGPGGSPNAGGSANSQSANSPLLTFAQCMRSHRVPDFPDPQPGASNAKFPTAQQLGVSNSRYQAAENACQHLLPAGIDDEFPPAEAQLLLNGMRTFSQCVRSHGVPNWPDPTLDSQGRPLFPLSSHGFTLEQAHSPQLGAKEAECQHLIPRALGGIPEG